MHFQRFSLSKNAELLPGLVRCYQDVFATLPWGEWRKCAVCDTHWGIESSGELEATGFLHCGVPIQAYWPADEVERDLVRELTIPGVSCWLAFDESRIIGFTHGYPVDVCEIDRHLGLDGVGSSIIEAFGSISSIAYQDEMGVIAEYRGLKIAAELFRLRNVDFKALGLSTGVVRTMTNPPTVTYRWYNAIGYQTVGRYDDNGGRVVLARLISDLP